MSESKVGERLSWLKRRKVHVRVSYAETGQLANDTFEAVYEDVIPLGREYFFVFTVKNRKAMFRTTSVVEIREAD